MTMQILQWCIGVVFAIFCGPEMSHAAVNHPFSQAALKLKGQTIDLTNLKEIQGFDYTDAEYEKLKLWKNGDIPYFIDVFSFDKVLRDRIREVLKDANNYGGVHFTEINKPPTDLDKRYVFFINRRGLQECSDPPYYSLTPKGVQKVTLGYDCMSYGELAGVALSIVGVPPQHNAPGRESVVKINNGNILPDKTHLFQVIPNNEWLFHELNYDYDSATHFNLHQHTSNGKAGINIVNRSAVPPGASLGEPNKFSYLDVVKMRMLYNYINRHQKTDIDECSMLFKPGKFDRAISDDSADEIKPRVKPSKYTGKPDDASNEAKSDEEDKSTEKRKTDKEDQSLEKHKTDKEDQSLEKRKTDKEDQSLEKRKTDKEDQSLEKRKTDKEDQSLEKRKTDKEDQSLEKRKTDKEDQSLEKRKTDKEDQSLEKRKTDKEDQSLENHKSDTGTKSSGRGGRSWFYKMKGLK